MTIRHATSLLLWPFCYRCTSTRAPPKQPKFKRTSVLAPRCYTTHNATEVKGSADNLIAACHVVSTRIPCTQTSCYAPDTGKILSTTAADKDNTMVLQVVSLARNVRLHGLARRQFDLGHFTLGRVGLLRLRNEDLADDTLLVRIALQKRGLRGLDSLFGLPAGRLIQGGGSGERRVECTRESQRESSAGQTRRSSPSEKRQRRPWPGALDRESEGGEHSVLVSTSEQ